MTNLTFSQLELSPELLAAVTEMGFTETTDVQAEAIPVIRTGADVMARSQTGTGKTVAFGIPAVELVVPEDKYVQVLILSPTRELAQQCGDELRKLARHLPYIKTADIYGGADFRRQFVDLREANIVIGTPGRVMDHMRRGSLHLNHLKMIVLDEADEMLNMGFKEDIETILTDVPEERQIVLFSATVPPEILTITRQFQKDPVLIEINRDQVTLDSIVQTAVDVPMRHKPEALNLLLHYYKPQRAIIFANTKSMVDELTEGLNAAGFSVEGLHGDMKQLQRTRVMNAFKKGKVAILVATDVAARGIDVNDVDYVFNFDIPKVADYYVHRIGRTGRAGKTGTAVTLCCGRQQVMQLQQLARRVKSTITPIDLPTVADIERSNRARDVELVDKALQAEPMPFHTAMVEELMAKGHTPEKIAAILLGLYFRHDTKNLTDLPKASKAVRTLGDGEMGQKVRVREHHSSAEMVIDMGYANRVAANHIVGAITERTGISSREIGKIEISETFSTVAVPADKLEDIMLSMQGCKLCGKPIHVMPLVEEPGRKKTSRPAPPIHRPYKPYTKKPGERKKY
ncbi:MAG: DEAD/DEAH box helicase [Oscillibacter sp.]